MSPSRLDWDGRAYWASSNVRCGSTKTGARWRGAVVVIGAAGWALLAAASAAEKLMSRA